MKQQIHITGILLLILSTIGFPGGAYARDMLSMGARQLYFVENRGQIVDQYGKQRADIDFRMACGHGLNIFIGSGAIHYQWAKAGTAAGAVEMNRMDIQLLGANAPAAVVVDDRQSYYERYYLPQTGAGGVAAAACRKITYREIYPGIDWVIYIRDAQMEYDFVVRPGGKVSDIRMQYGGAASLTLNEDGGITAVTETGTATQRAPHSFREEDRRKVDSRFVLDGDVLGFAAGSCEGTLVIDPVMEWGRYYGGNAQEISFGSAVDNNDGSVYMSGTTLSTGNIATIGAFKTTLSSGGEDFFLAKFNAAGLRVWSTYYGGEGPESGGAVICDRNGNVYLGGSTQSTTGMATPGSFRQTFGGGNDDGILVKFDASGSRVWGTYYGGTGSDAVLNISCDVYDNVYFSGITSSDTGVSTPNSHQVARNASGSAPINAFLAKFDDNGMRQWATYYGWNTTGMDVFADKFGAVYLAGSATRDSNITTPGAHQRIPGGVAGMADCYLAKFDSTGTRIWGTLYGGAGSEFVGAIPWKMHMISGDDSGNIYLAGTTESTDSIATPGSYQDTKNGAAGETDGFLVKFDSSGKRQWGTYYGGPGGFMESVASMAADHSGNVYLVGTTESTSGIATPNAHQVALAGGMVDAFLVQFDRSGARKYGTYYGGGGMDLCFGVVSDLSGNVYISGATQSDTGIATPGSQFYIGDDAFLAKFCFAIPPASFSGADTICVNTSYTYSVPAVAGGSYIWEWPAAWNAAATGNSISVTTDQGDAAGTVSVRIVKCGDTSEPVTFDVYVRPAVPAEITVNGNELSTVNTHESYQWYLNGTAIPGATNRSHIVDTNGFYSVKVVNPHGCTDSSDVYPVTNVSVSSLSAGGRAVTVYPNPAHGTVYVAAAVPVSVQISSMEGKAVLQHQQAGAIDISGLADGIYLMQVRTDGRLIHTEKLIKSPR